MSLSSPSYTISMEEFDAYGFDIDHTLATYNIPNLFELLHTSFTRFLVEKKGYDKDLLKPFHKYKQFCARGLIYDVHRGNFLKIANDGNILRASHGTEFLTSSAIESAYPDRHWQPTDKLIDHVDNIGDDEYMIFDNFFDMIGTVILSRLVELVDRKAESLQTDYKKQFNHIREAYSYCYEVTAFAANSGGFFPAVVADPGRYLNKIPESTRTWLKRLRQEGKVVFFLSSSHIDFATFSLEYILGENWMNYFDIGISRAHKPGFFNTDRPFLALENMSEKAAVEKLESGKVYSQGNLDTLTEFIAHTTGKKNPKVIYFGDSIRSDIYPSRYHAVWTTVTVMAELEGELPRDVATQPQAKRLKYDEKCQQLCGFIPDSLWGSYFTDSLPSTGAKKASADSVECLAPPLNTLWGHILRKYSSLVIPSLQHIAELPRNHGFSVFNPNKPRQWGFHPSLPLSLVKHT